MESDLIFLCANYCHGKDVGYCWRSAYWRHGMPISHSVSYKQWGRKLQKRIDNKQKITGRVVNENYQNDFWGRSYQVSVIRSDTGEKVVVDYCSSVCDKGEVDFLNTLFQEGDLVELDVGELPKVGATGGQKYIGVRGRLGIENNK